MMQQILMWLQDIGAVRCAMTFILTLCSQTGAQISSGTPEV